jgi:hypothetical protein
MHVMHDNTILWRRVNFDIYIIYVFDCGALGAPVAPFCDPDRRRRFRGGRKHLGYESYDVQSLILNHLNTTTATTEDIFELINTACRCRHGKEDKILDKIQIQACAMR